MFLKGIGRTGKRWICSCLHLGVQTWTLYQSYFLVPRGDCRFNDKAYITGGWESLILSHFCDSGHLPLRAAEVVFSVCRNISTGEIVNSCGYYFAFCIGCGYYFAFCIGCGYCFVIGNRMKKIPECIALVSLPIKVSLVHIL